MDHKFGNFICQLREQKGISQSELGKLVGVSNAAVSKWENGKSIPPMKTLKLLSMIFHVSVEELLNGEYKTPVSPISQTVVGPDGMPVYPIGTPFPDPPAPPVRRSGWVYVLMIVLFILNFTTLHLALFLTSLAGPSMNAAEPMWRFFIPLPIPVASIVFGFIFRKKGYKTLKNIVAGFIFAGLLTVYGCFSLIPVFFFSHDYSYVNQVEQAIQFDLPDQGRISTIDWSPDSSSDQITDSLQTLLNSSEVQFKNSEETRKFEKAVTESELWLPQLPQSLQEALPLYSSFETEGQNFYLLYNLDCAAYNTVPPTAGQYHFLFLAYHPETNKLSIIEYQAITGWRDRS